MHSAMLDHSTCGISNRRYHHLTTATIAWVIGIISVMAFDASMKETSGTGRQEVAYETLSIYHKAARKIQKGLE
jgi:hypothetical protein